MRITWKYDKESEARRILYTCCGLIKNCYQNINFYVVDKLPDDNTSYLIYLSDLHYKDIKNYWSKIKKCEYNVNAKYSKNLVKSVNDRLSKIDTLTKEEIERIQKEWKKKEKKFREYLNILFPSAFKQINRITICPTLFGTNGSYSLLDKKGNITIHYRIDGDLHYLAETIILSITHSLDFPCDRNQTEMIENKRWFLKQRLAHFLSHNTKIADLFPLLKKPYKKPKQNIINESIAYMKRIGLYQEGKLHFRKNNIYFDKKQISHLTKSQERILKLLMNNKGKIVSFEQIAKELWGREVEKKYSLYAITRLIADIRKKLRDNQIYTEFIHTQRGKGYILYS
ncbi:helix-turn-helix domain-containing protein [Patescibacteria group bacterium]